jgi:hypothetical protein
MDQLQQFTGVATVYRPDGSALPGERRYSITLVPWYESARPLAISSWVELHHREPLELENEHLTIQLTDGRWVTFRVTDVSETPPHHHTFVAQHWPAHRAG